MSPLSVTVYRFADSGMVGEKSFEEGDSAETYSFKDTVKVGIYEDLEIDLGGLAEYLRW